MAQPTRVSRPHMPGYGLLPPEEGEGLLPWSWAEERLETSRSFWLATASADGEPHCMPVWALWHEGALFVSTGGRTRKAQNLRENPRCWVSTENGEEPVVLEGRARVVEDAALIALVLERYTAKYGMPFPDGSPVFEIAPRKAIGLVEEAARFPGAATRWHFD